MSKFQFFVGIDIASKSFAAAIFSKPQAPIPSQTDVPNTIEGFEQLKTWFTRQGVLPGNSVVCLEATGVYGEELCYWLFAQGFIVAVEPPLKIKRAFSDKSHKNDKADSCKIAEYAYRFTDELHFWRPKTDVIEQIRVLLATREQLIIQRTAQKNYLRTLERKVVQTPMANKYLRQNIDRFTKQILRIEKELKDLIDKYPDFRQMVTKLKTIPGVGLLLAVNFLAMTNGFENLMAENYRKSAAFIGICPYEYTSGTSVFKRARIPHYGPSRIRKLLHLAARSVVTHNQRFQKYYVSKQLQGKPNKLILNNVANKILKIMCAVIRDRNQFVNNHVSINPNYMLTRS